MVSDRQAHRWLRCLPPREPGPHLARSRGSIMFLLWKLLKRSRRMLPSGCGTQKGRRQCAPSRNPRASGLSLRSGQGSAPADSLSAKTPSWSQPGLSSWGDGCRRWAASELNLDESTRRKLVKKWEKVQAEGTARHRPGVRGEGSTVGWSPEAGQTTQGPWPSEDLGNGELWKVPRGGRGTGSILTFRATPLGPKRAGAIMGPGWEERPSEGYRVKPSHRPAPRP